MIATRDHVLRRAFDVATVDGEIVRPDSHAARALAAELTKRDVSIRPTEIGSPWAIAGPEYFTDADHQNHIHIGFDGAISAGWKPRNEARVMPALRRDQIDGS